MAQPKVLVLTPVKNATRHLPGYLAALRRLDYPRTLLSLGFLESDSSDATYDQLDDLVPKFAAEYRRVTLTKQDFGFHIPEGVPRWAPPFQVPRRVVLAKARNRLLFAALGDEDWVLWLDVDVCDYPPDILTQMIATGKDIVNPHCVTRYGGPTFDWNAWRNKGETHMNELRGGSDLVRLDAVGAAMLLIRADLHREGLVFPSFLYGGRSRFARDISPLTGRGVGEVESEGLGIMAKDMGYECWGMPNLEVLHRNE